jgi:hypothetical protein
MAKVIGIHEVELRPGAQAADLERFITEEFIPASQRVPGMQVSLLKADRGERVGKYVMLMEIESVETRDRYFPSSGEPSEAFQRAMPTAGALMEKLGALGSSTFTDYVVVGK